MKQKKATPYDNVVNESATKEKNIEERMVSGFEFCYARAPFAECALTT